LLIRDRNAQGLYDVLNQYEYGCTIDQARHDLQRALRFVDDMSYRYISNVIGDIRRRAKTGELDFTISPCKRGPNGDGLIFVVPKQEDGTFEVSDNHRDEFDFGAYGSMRELCAKAETAVSQMVAMATHETKRRRKADLLECADNFGFALRKMKRAMENWEERAA